MKNAPLQPKQIQVDLEHKVVGRMLEMGAEDGRIIFLTDMDGETVGTRKRAALKTRSRAGSR